MKKFATFLLSLITCCGLTIGLAGCEGDASTPPTLSTSDTPSDTTSEETGDAENDATEDNSGNEGNEDETEEWIATDGLAYALSEDESHYVLSGIGTATDTEIVIADVYNQKPVKEIGEKAFMDCSSLTTVKIPDSITAIGSAAFQGCDNLENIHIKDIAKWCTIDFADVYSNPLALGEANGIPVLKKLYLNNKVVRDLIIPEGVTSIGAYAFYCCFQLRSITLPDSLTSIGNWAFMGCVKLTSITIPASVKLIGDNAFEGCVEIVNKSNLPITTSAEVITDEKDSKIIKQGDYLFYNDNGSYYLIGYTGTETDLVLPDNVENNNYRLGSIFYFDTFITSIEISDGVSGIYEEDFIWCLNLTSMVINARFIDWNAFFCCPNLTSVVIGDNVGSIKENAFNACSGLKNITVVEENTKYASQDGILYNKDKTDLIIAPKGIESIYIPDSVQSIGYDLAWCENLKDITVAEENENYASQDGILYNKDKTILMQYPNKKSETIFTIPDSVQSIGYSAFEGCSSLTSIEIPDNVQSIGNYAFSGCDGLTSINIPDSVQSIGYSAFSGCDGLTSINIPDSVQSIGYSAFYGCSKLIQIENGVHYVDKWAIDCDTSASSVSLRADTKGIGDFAFEDCSSLTSVEIGDGVQSIGESAFEDCSSLTSVEIGDGVQSIGKSAFEDCSSLTSVVIGNSVQSIGEEAFDWCNALTTVYYKGTESEWNAISIDSYGNNYLTSATRYYYSENPPTGEGNYWHYVDGEPTAW